MTNGLVRQDDKGADLSLRRAPLIPGESHQATPLVHLAHYLCTCWTSTLINAVLSNERRAGSPTSREVVCPTKQIDPICHQYSVFVVERKGRRDYNPRHMICFAL